MRSGPTEAERTLWRVLRAHRFAGWKWRRQQPLGAYIVDFICFERRLIVEADGSQHRENPYDLHRDAWLRSQGFRVVRFWNNDVLARSDQVRDAIHAALNGEADASPTPLPGPLPQGERVKKEDDCA